ARGQRAASYQDAAINQDVGVHLEDQRITKLHFLATNVFQSNNRKRQAFGENDWFVLRLNRRPVRLQRDDNQQQDRDPDKKAAVHGGKSFRRWNSLRRLMLVLRDESFKYSRSAH